MLNRYSISLLAIALSGCTVINAVSSGASGTAGSSSGTANNEEAEEPDVAEGEASVIRISRRMRKFRKSLAEKQFPKARAHLAKAQRYINKAGDLTRGHPDFEDTESAVQNARMRLDSAIEQDRLERREAAVNDLITRGQTLVKQAHQLYARVGQDVVNEAHVAALDEKLGTFADYRSEGKQFLDEVRYANHAHKRNKTEGDLRELKTTTRWYVDAGSAVATPVEQGIKAAKEANKSKDLGRQMELFSQVQSAFQVCITTVDDLKKESSYDAKRRIKTHLGTHSLKETRKRCADMVRQAKQQVDGRSWEMSVSAVITAMRAPLGKMKAAATVGEEIESTKVAIAVLSKCLKDLDRTERRRGFKSDKVFTTPLGKMAAIPLRKACKSKRDTWVHSLPRIQWRANLEPTIGKLAKTTRIRDAAKKDPDAASRAKRWQQAAKGFATCAGESNTAASKKSSIKGHIVNSTLGKLSMSALEKACRKQESAAQAALAASKRAIEIEKFAATTQGDEKTVARRDGIPTKVEPFARGKFKGRVFVYAKDAKAGKGKPQVRRFGFDSKGKQVDYWANWRKTMDDTNAQLRKALNAVSGAKRATARIEAAKRAGPILDRCVKVVKVAKDSPGHDAKARFDTPLGKTGAADLAALCAKRKKTHVDSGPKWRWQAKVEALADRLDKFTQLAKQKGSKLPPSEHVKVFGRALGGLDECSESAASLAKDKVADSKFKAATAQGKLTIRGIADACDKLKPTMSTRADEAIAALALAEFLKDCKADEIAAVEREGLPEEVQAIASGRVFVYRTKSRGKPQTRRIAFDSKGMRINEKLLQAELNAKPKHTRVKVNVKAKAAPSTKPVKRP